VLGRQAVDPVVHALADVEALPPFLCRPGGILPGDLPADAHRVIPGDGPGAPGFFEPVAGEGGGAFVGGVFVGVQCGGGDCGLLRDQVFEAVVDPEEHPGPSQVAARDPGNLGVYVAGAPVGGLAVGAFFAAGGHYLQVGGSELLVKWVLPKTSGRKAGVQVVLIK